MKKSWQFFKKNWWGLANILFGIVVLWQVHLLSKIDLMVGVWLLLNTVALLIDWHQKRNFWELMLAIVNLILAIPLGLQIYSAVIPMVYLVIAILILNSAFIFNIYYSASRNSLSIRILLWIFLIVAVSLILYPWFTSSIWLLLFAGYFIVLGIIIILAYFLID